MQLPRITYDHAGTPGILADHAVSAYAGLGFLHGRHRPLQTLILTAAARGQLGQRLIARADLLSIDAAVHRLDLLARAAVAERELDTDARACIDAYLVGVDKALRAHGTPHELRLLMANLPTPTVADVLAALMLSAYLGLAECQERMEQALLSCIAAGAQTQVLSAMFAPHLENCDFAVVQQLAPAGALLGFANTAVGGSNAWAVSGDRSASGYPMLCGDPHLQVNQLPSLLFEVRARVGDDFWLGATIPGLPGIAVGRNRNVAWSGTFAVADNVDATAVGPGVVTQSGLTREVRLGRRFRAPLALSFIDTPHGTLKGELAVAWAGAEHVAQTMAAYIRLPSAVSVAQAAYTLRDAHTLSLHFVLADRAGDLRYKQVGRIPRRSGNWSGLAPSTAETQRWTGFVTGADLPESTPVDGIIVSANEARQANDGVTLSTFAQPSYRRDRIDTLLRAQAHHDLASMRAIQNDVLSLQAVHLLPFLLPHVPDGPVQRALLTWDHRYDTESVGAHAFSLVYRAGLQGLAPLLGHAHFEQLLRCSELSVWWAHALDRALLTYSETRGVQQSIARISQTPLTAWGKVQRADFKHMILGGIGLGYDRKSVPLVGCIATIRQGNLVPAAHGVAAVAPAYQMICDLGADALYTALPGGIDGSRWQDSYVQWLDAWCSGEYHRIAPPDLSEQRLEI